MKTSRNGLPSFTFCKQFFLMVQMDFITPVIVKKQADTKNLIYKTQTSCYLYIK